MFKKPKILLTLLILFSCEISLVAGFEKGETYHGFKLIDKKFVKEVNADCYYFIHQQSGARLLKIVADDANKTFSIAFKTVPQSDAGTPHIMEHSVLNGSKHFPVKSPFDVLMKGSLNTFLNAMTGSHVTIYPVASMNNKDFFNLMHVYLDAVFYPLIYDDPRILNQEGWHYELTDKESPIIYKGVVYNEMKGAFSSPERELSYQVYKNLFPNNGYGFSSGGYPPAIPTLSYEDFLNFHRRFYHPANSYIFLYGDADMDKELAFINDKYLSDFKKIDVNATFAMQKPFEAQKQVSAFYPVPNGGETKDQTYMSLSFVTGKNIDRALEMALDVISDVLVNQESAPVRLALQEAGVGKEVHASIDDIKQNVFEITIQNANPENKDKFREIVLNTMRDVVKKGLDKEAVEGTINRMEFRLREGNTSQKGLNYNFQALNGWFFAEDPFLTLEYEKPLAKIKTALKTDLLEKIISKNLIDNPHSLVVVLEPKPGMENEINQKAADELEKYKASLSDEKLETLVNGTQTLIDFQKREDTPEALATIPLLDLKDVNPKAEWFEVSEKKVSGVPALHFEDFTNNVVYVRLYFDTRVLPEELIPYSALLSEVLGKMNTENYSYGDLDNALNIHTGGFDVNLNTYLEDLQDENLLPKMEIGSKAMNGKVNKLFELTSEIVNRSKLDDKDRLKAVLTRHQSRLDSRIKGNGYGYARRRAASYFTNRGVFEEQTAGIEYYWFVTELAKNFDEQADQIIDNLKKTAALLFTKSNLISAVTCNQADFSVFSKGLQSFVKDLLDAKTEFQTWSFDLSPKNEGFLSASKVQYVIKGYDFKKLGYQWDGKMRVLNQVLSSDWLQTQIRVVGGAYGGFCSFSPTGEVFFSSYRDPNLKGTLENYDATPGYLHAFEADESTMTRYIIGTIASMDRPRTPSQKGDVAVRRYFEKSTYQEAQSDRDAVLATTAGDIRNMEKLVSDILQQNLYCVYGNQSKVEEAKDLFKEVMKLER